MNFGLQLFRLIVVGLHQRRHSDYSNVRIRSIYHLEKDMSQESSQASQELCPYSQCTWSGSLCQLLEHFRICHDLSLMPANFIVVHKLKQCPKCLHWYLCLNQHSSKCKEHRSVAFQNSDYALSRKLAYPFLYQDQMCQTPPNVMLFFIPPGKLLHCQNLLRLERSDYSSSRRCLPLSFNGGKGRVVGQ